MKIAIASLFGMVVAVPLAFAEPNGGERPPHRRPPEEAFTACASLAEGDACTVKHHDREMTGQCRKVPDFVKEDAGKLVCAPHGHRPPPPPQ